MLVLLVLWQALFAFCLQPYGQACYELACERAWECDNIVDVRDKLQCLCKNQQFRKLTEECLEIAANNTLSSPQLCPQASTLSTEELSNEEKTRIPELVASAKESLSKYSIELNRSRSDRYSNAVWAFWLIVITIYMVVSAFSKIFPKQYMWMNQSAPSKVLRKYILYSGNGKVLDMITVQAFALVLLILLLVNIPLLEGTPTSLQMLKQVADRAAYLSIKCLPLLIFFGGRNTVLMSLSGWNINTYNYYHKWIGRLMLLLFVVHGTCYASIKVSLRTLSAAMKLPLFQFGTCALVFLGVIILHSLRFSRKFHYDLFVWLHVGLTILFIAFGYTHVKNILWNGARQYIWAAISLWIIDKILRLLNIGANGFNKRALVTVHDNNSCEIEIEKWKPRANGSFVFVHFVQSRPWQSHPFSHFYRDGKLRLIVYPRNGVTATLPRLGVKHSTQVLVDGPYGYTRSFIGYDTVVLVVGGSGITAVIEYMSLITRTLPDTTIYLHWAIPTENDLELVDHLLHDFYGSVIITVYLYSQNQCTSVNASVVTLPGSAKNYNEDQYCLIRARMDVHEIVSSHLQNDSKGTIAVLSCGPQQMNRDARKAVKDAVLDSTNYIGYFCEDYTW